MPKMSQRNTISPDRHPFTVTASTRHWGMVDAGAGKQTSVRPRPEAAGAPAGTPE